MGEQLRSAFRNVVGRCVDLEGEGQRYSDSDYGEERAGLLVVSETNRVFVYSKGIRSRQTHLMALNEAAV